MKTKRLLSGLITVAMLLSLCVTTAFAANSGYKAGLTVEKKDENKLSVSCDAGPSGTSVNIQGAQTFIVAFDLEVLKPLLKNGKEFTLNTTPEFKAMAYEMWENPNTAEVWDTKVLPYKSSDNKIGFIIIQPGNFETATLTETISLAKIYLGFQTGKSYADVKEDTVRFATAAELKGMSEDKAIRFNDGTDANGFEWSNGGTGDTLTFTSGNEPKVVAKGFTFAGTSTTYKVSFDANGGTGTMADVTGISGSYTLPANGFTAPAGQQFKGWATSASGTVITGTSITVSTDTKLYAIWEPIPVTTYTVSFDANGGTGTMADVTGISGSYTLPANGFTAPAGQQFKGWATSASGAVITDASITVSADTTLYAIWEPIPVTEYTITFNVNGGSGTIPPQTTSGQKLSSLPTATRSGSYSFDGWYTSGGTQITTAYVFSADTTVYAHWTYIGGSVGVGSYTPSYTVSVDKTENGTITVSPQSASNGSIVTITVKPDKGYTLETLRALDMSGYAMELTENNGRFTFKMPASAVIVKATFMDDNTMLNFFVDVKASDYFYDAVLWAAEKGVTSGADALHFNPNAPCTRAQIVTFLWRAAGSPAPKNMSSFADVPADAFYAKAVAWAVENGITGGTGDGKFSPDATCTRAQAVTFLYRASGAPAVSGNAAFSDVATNAYYAAAVKWAEKNGITGGIGGGLFGSNNNCTRAQIVTFLYRSVK